MSDINIFEAASRQKIRFTSPRGELTVEDLWDLPLKSARANTPNLDDVARTVYQEIKAVQAESEISFVSPATPVQTNANLKREVVKHIIGVRMAENSQKVRDQETQTKIRQLEELIQKKGQEQMNAMSIEDLQKQLAALKGA